MVLHKLLVVCRTVVSCQKYQIVVAPYFAIESSEKPCQILVEFQIGLVGMASTCAPLMSYHIRLRITDTQHVCLFALPQLFAINGSNGHISGYATCKGVEANVFANLLEILVLNQFGIEILSPLG